MVGLINSCSSKENLDYLNAFEKSKKAWLDFKASTNDSYQYTTESGSWTDSSTEITLTISKGKIIKREVKYKENNEVVQHWIESGEEEVGKHKVLLSELLTLDEVYSKAKQWLVKGNDKDLVFKAENKGLISTCGYFKKGCDDDCFVGIEIINIQPA